MSGFVGSTRFISQLGRFKLEDLTGDTLQVLTFDGKFRDAKIYRLHEERIWEVTLSTGNTYRCTFDHRWYIKWTHNHSIFMPTYQLHIGLKLDTLNDHSDTMVLSVKETNDYDVVYCPFEPVTSTFVLECSEVTGCSPILGGS